MNYVKSDPVSARSGHSVGNQHSWQRSREYDEHNHVSRELDRQRTCHLFHCIFLCLLYSFQKEQLHIQIRKVCFAFLSKQKANALLKICSLIYRTFANFLTGQCLEAVILGSMFAVTLSILKMPYALLIGILIAFTALIPIFGAFIGCALGCFSDFYGKSEAGNAVYPCISAASAD